MEITLDFNIERYGLTVRLVNENDAEFIVALRTDSKLSRYIHQTSTDIEVQRQWIKGYKAREAENKDFYFMFEKPLGTKLGVCRIYDIEEESFTIGSWIFSPQAPVGASILADIITREFAYELFPNKKQLFDVKRGNITVNRYNETYKSELLYQDEETNYYTCSIENFEKYKKIYLRVFYKNRNDDKKK
jgi:hypothetical protein